MEFEFVEHNPGVDTKKAMGGYEDCRYICEHSLSECIDMQLQGYEVAMDDLDLVRQNNLYWTL